MRSCKELFPSPGTQIEFLSLAVCYLRDPAAKTCGSKMRRCGPWSCQALRVRFIAASWSCLQSKQDALSAVENADLPVSLLHVVRYLTSGNLKHV